MVIKQTVVVNLKYKEKIIKQESIEISPFVYVIVPFSAQVWFRGHRSQLIDHEVKRLVKLSIWGYRHEHDDIFPVAKVISQTANLVQKESRETRTDYTLEVNIILIEE